MFGWFRKPETKLEKSWIKSKYNLNFKKQYLKSI
jgi:hypothetical protein